MKCLNLCCGANRIPDLNWLNLDHLYPVLPEGSPERNNLKKEVNYLEHDILSGPMSVAANTFDLVVASHCFEHWDCQEAVQVMRECLRVLKPGGRLVASVPDATYFRTVHPQDTVENAMTLFGEPIHLPDGETTFFGYGLFNKFHKAILTEVALWAYFTSSGFTDIQKGFFDQESLKALNRPLFSLVMNGRKE